jgi:SNF family Na+-dependent transporter
MKIILLIFLVRGVTLPGSSDGIKYFVIPQWEKMLSTKVIQLMTFATSGVTYSEHFHANTNM